MKNFFEKELQKDILIQIEKISADFINDNISSAKIFDSFVKVLKNASDRNRISYLLKKDAESSLLYKENKHLYASQDKARSLIMGREAVIIARALSEKVSCQINDFGLIELDNKPVEDSADFYMRVKKMTPEYHDSAIDAAINQKTLFDEDEEELPSLDEDYFS
ncbi:MAG: hypothetical protein HFI85_03280 [Clostridia bacterium]|jgi:hypothetical protein|nr:hypothetical protein [Clostridia bacterium]